MSEGGFLIPETHSDANADYACSLVGSLMDIVRYMKGSMEPTHSLVADKLLEHINTRMRKDTNILESFRSVLKIVKKKKHLLNVLHQAYMIHQGRCKTTCALPDPKPGEHDFCKDCLIMKDINEAKALVEELVEELEPLEKKAELYNDNQPLVEQEDDDVPES